ncbi:MAG TPA: glycosyltransferase family 4 protein [Thermoanaerobaculia bacterium]|nr:glycosyltransferase family 4 protein [Thermoanaerobaculia bacterium]
MHRVALIASHVIQYQAPFFRLLAAEPDLDLDVIFCSTDGAKVYRDEEMQTTFRWDLDLLSGYRHRFLRNFGFGEGYTRLINPGIVPTLLLGKYDAIVFFLGWGTITSLLGIAAARMRGTPILMFGDSSYPPPENTFASKVRAGVMRAIFRLTDRFLVSGVLNADYYRHYGIDEKRFHLVPWAIDNARFEEGSRFEEGEREAMRARFGIRDDQMAIVFSGKFLPRKDPMTLLRAVDGMHHRDRTAVIFLGNGELSDEMQRFARERNLAVHFAGFVNQTELPKYYAMADVFVLPSLDDPRATVVNEAMASGLPIVITDRCGPMGDIVQHGDNGYVFAPGDVATLAQHLDSLAGDPELRARMAQRSREIISTWDYARGVIGVKEALASC